MPSGRKKGAPGLDGWVVKRDRAVPIWRWSGEGSFLEAWICFSALSFGLFFRSFHPFAGRAPFADRERGGLHEQSRRRAGGGHCAEQAWYHKNEVFCKGRKSPEGLIGLFH